MNDVILVFYLYIGNMVDDEIPGWVERIKRETSEKKPEGSAPWFYIVTRTGENRVECINPKFITDQARIDEAMRQLESINQHFTNELSLEINKPEKFYINKKDV
jgi:hypothetical protein